MHPFIMPWYYDILLQNMPPQVSHPHFLSFSFLKKLINKLIKGIPTLMRETLEVKKNLLVLNLL